MGRTLNTKIRILKSYEDIEPYIDMARQGADTERSALGFLPPNAYKQAAEQGKLLIAVDPEGNFLGHLMFGGVFPHGKVIQIYSGPEFRKQGIAQSLINELVKHAHERSYLSLSAKVASDLSEANAFYERMGFHAVSTIPGGKTRKRIIYRRVRDLDTPSLFDFMANPEDERLPNLGIASNYSTRPPIYAIDLNVLFDVTKRRGRGEEAGKVMKASFNNDIRLVITEEFINELKRTTSKFPDDPHLQIALQMSVLPTPKSKETSDIERKLAGVIFKERFHQDILTTQDKSDLRHLATVAHHRIAGFITNENAILRAHERLRSEFGLDVLGVSDFADAMSSGSEKFGLDEVARTSDTVLSFGPLSQDITENVRFFLNSQYVPLRTIKDVISLGDSVSPQKHIILSEETDIVSFASWNLVQNPRKMVEVFLCANEGSPAARTAIDHTLNRICRVVSSGAPARMRLQILPGNPVTRNIALAHGFRPGPGQESHGTAFYKIAIGDVIDARSWCRIKRALKSLADVELPQNIPVYEDPNQRILIKTSLDREEAIPLKELETLLSPSLILLPGRFGAIVPIKRVFADELLGTAEQFSLLTPPEAVFLKERVFYNTPRAASNLAPGTLILFYESSEGGGRKSIVAVGRATDSHVITGDQVSPDMKRRGVLDANGFKHIGVGKSKLVTAFDNIMVFKKPVPLNRLREIGCADGANFVTTKRIEPDHLKTILNEGLKNE